jgi:uncharacterized protein YbaP (TraB family)
MRKTLFPLLVTALLTIPAVLKPAPAHAEFGHYAFDFNVFTWKITKPEARNPDADPPSPDPSGVEYDPFGHQKIDYLVGTMHFPVKPDEEDVPAGLKKILEKSTAFVMEADLAKFDRAQVRRHLSLAPGQNLQLALPARTWQVLAANYQSKGITPAQLAHLKPWLLELMWANTQRMGSGLDSYLKNFAAGRSKRLLYLEGMEDQIRALDAGTFEERVDMLTHSVDDPEVQIDTLHAMLDSYKGGYLEASRGLVFDEEMMRHYPVYYKELFDDRNNAWLPKIEGMMASEDAVIAVGLGHLIGPDGVLAKLKDKGYTIERVPFDY